jgi:hypothetical protein
MVYYTYARGPEHTDANVATGLPAVGTHLTVWTSDSGGTQITALRTLADGALPGYVTVDSFGRYEFRINSQANPVVWMKDPSAKFWQILASEIIGQVPTAISDAATAAVDAAAAVVAAAAAEAAATANLPGGSAVANRVPWRNASNVYAWSAASEVVANALGWKIATDPAYGADPTGVADATTALQACLDAAAAAGTTAYLSGTFKTTAVITVKGDLDAHTATVNYTPGGAGGVAIQVGDPASQLFRATVKLPVVINTKKTTTGWAQTGVSGSTGVKVSNCYSCSITLPRVNAFATGVLVTGVPIGAAIQGTQQCSFYPLHLDNNKVNFAVTPYQGTATTDSGWANQNYVFGGRMSHDSAEGSQVSGTRHLLFSDAYNIVNGWCFYGTSLESPDVVEYHVECFGQYITLHGCRWENTGGDSHRRVWSRGTAKNSWIVGGFNAGQITQSKESTAYPFRHIDDIQMATVGGSSTQPALLIENLTSSTAPALTIMGAGAALAGDAPSTAYAVQATSQKWSGKRPTDTYDRLQADYLNGRFYVGDAVSAHPVAYIGGSASAMFVGGGVPFCPLADSAQDLGTSGLKWRDLRLSRGLGAFGATPPTSKPTVTGSRGGNAALASLLTALESFGLITDSSSA